MMMKKGPKEYEYVAEELRVQMKNGTTSSRYIERLCGFARVWTTGLTDHHAASPSAARTREEEKKVSAAW